MTYPTFFDNIETIKLKDDLSSFLGAFEDGLIEFTYVDLVKTSGHSCPTVLGAYLMTLQALKALYKEEIPKRGEIKVEFQERQTQGVTGVISNVITNITGACKDNGFKGINGKFDRNHLMKFESDIGDISAKFTRVDTKESVNVIYDANTILPNPNMKILMQKIMQNQATLEDKIEFGKLWQKRVEDISKNIDKVITLQQD